MIVAGQRVESLNCGWMVAQEDSEVKRGVRVKVLFENTGNIKGILTHGFLTGNARDSMFCPQVGDILRSTQDGAFEILEIRSNMNVSVKFSNTGNIVRSLQKDAVVCGHISDQKLRHQAQLKKYNEDYQKAKAQQDILDQKSAIKHAEAIALHERREQRELRKLERVEKQEQKARLQATYEMNATTAIEITPNSKPENSNNLNVDFKDRDGNWVLRFKCQGEFRQTRLGKCHNNMTQRVGRSGYEDVTISSEFLDPQKFCDWAVKQIGWGMGYHLEKDLLVKGNKEYSSETCCFVPQIINTSIIPRSRESVIKKVTDGYSVKFMKNYLKIHLGVYPTYEQAVEEFEKYLGNFIKSLAEKYKNTISEDAYNALLSWEHTERY